MASTENAKVTYTVQVAFTLNLGEASSKLSFRLKAGDVLQYDGLNVSFNGVTGHSPSLRAAIREGWVAEGTGTKKGASKKVGKTDNGASFFSAADRRGNFPLANGRAMVERSEDRTVTASRNAAPNEVVVPVGKKAAAPKVAEVSKSVKTAPASPSMPERKRLQVVQGDEADAPSVTPERVSRENAKQAAEQEAKQVAAEASSNSSKAVYKGKRTTQAVVDFKVAPDMEKVAAPKPVHKEASVSKRTSSEGAITVTTTVSSGEVLPPEVTTTGNSEPIIMQKQASVEEDKPTTISKVEDIVVAGLPWKDAKFFSKVKFISTCSDLSILKLIEASNPPQSLRKVLTERLAALS